MILENFGATLQEILDKTKIEHIIISSMGENLGMIKGTIVNFVVRKIRKLVPPYSLPTAVWYLKALEIGSKRELIPHIGKMEDTVVIQYTGGTTGVSKGAELTNMNVLANTV